MTRSPESPSLESTAFHEAGHAVIAVVQGLPIDSVSIKPGKDSRGHCRHPNVRHIEHNTMAERREIVRELIIVSDAGYEAEKVFNSEAKKELAQDDDDNAFDLSREYGVSRRGCAAKARKLVMQHWPAIRAVAQALLKRKSLSGEDVAEIVRSCT